MMGPSTILTPPFLKLTVLATLPAALRHWCLHPALSSAASGAIVMAGGITALDALLQVPFPVREVTQPAALGLIMIWIVLARSYIMSSIHGTFSAYLANPVDSFAIGTWVAGTSVLGQMILFALPGWHPIAVVTWLLAFVLWLWFVVLAARGFRTIAVNPAGYHATGRILLSTVSTQSLVILTVSLFSASVPRWVFTGLVVLGYTFYGFGGLLIAERYVHQRGWRLADDWDDTNCILHGAMSITGLAAILSGTLTAGWIVGTWIWVAVMFVCIECVELARARARIRTYGWRQGLLSYHVSQWARVFTFGMFYAFSFHLRASLLTDEEFGWLLPLRSLIVGDFQYVVIGLLLVEAVLFARSNVHLWYNASRNEKGVLEAGPA